MTEKEVAENAENIITIRAKGQPEGRIQLRGSQSVRAEVTSLAEKLGLMVVVKGKELIEVRSKKNQKKIRICRARTQERQDALRELRRILAKKGIDLEQKPSSLKKRLEKRVRQIKPKRPSMRPI